MATPVLPDEPIQWHLNTSRHDRCPKCRGKLAFLGRRHRLCLGVCGVSITLDIPTTSWYAQRQPPKGADMPEKLTLDITHHALMNLLDDILPTGLKSEFADPKDWDRAKALRALLRLGTFITLKSEDILAVIGMELGLLFDRLTALGVEMPEKLPGWDRHTNDSLDTKPGGA